RTRLIDQSDGFALPRRLGIRFVARIRLGFRFSRELVLSFLRQTQRPQLFSLRGFGRALLPADLLQAHLGLLSLLEVVLSAHFRSSLRRRRLIHRIPSLPFWFISHRVTSSRAEQASS